MFDIFLFNIEFSGLEYAGIAITLTACLIPSIIKYYLGKRKVKEEEAKKKLPE